MANYNKRSRIGTILHDKYSYQEKIHRPNVSIMKEEEEGQKYMSIDEYRNMMKRISYIQMIQTIQLKQEKNKSNDNLFQAFFYIPVYVYNLVFCTNSKISNL